MVTDTVQRGTWGGGGPELCNTAKKIKDHCKKSPRNTVTATIIFSYIILLSSFDVYLNNYPQNKHIEMGLSMHVYSSILLIPVNRF